MDMPKLFNFCYCTPVLKSDFEFVNFQDYEEGSIIGEGATSTVKEVCKKEKFAKKELKQFDYHTASTLFERK